MSRTLLDVNVLLALYDPEHVHHQLVAASFEANPKWASCAITENGFVRVISLPSYTNPITPTRAIERLRAARTVSDHEFWNCDVSLLDPTAIDHTRLHGPKQITDAYLLALAVAHGGRFVTFDRSVALAAVHGATEDHLEVL